MTWVHFIYGRHTYIYNMLLFNMTIETRDHQGKVATFILSTDIHIIGNQMYNATKRGISTGTLGSSYRPTSVVTPARRFVHANPCCPSEVSGWPRRSCWRPPPDCRASPRTRTVSAVASARERPACPRSLAPSPPAASAHGSCPRELPAGSAPLATIGKRKEHYILCTFAVLYT